MLWWVAQMAMEYFLFTSESVNEGHPDKLADQVGSCCSGLPICRPGDMGISFLKTGLEVDVACTALK